MDLGIAGLRVLVTAGASGIGREVARAFVEEGARVHACDVDEAMLSALGESDPAVTSTVADVADRDAVGRLFEDALSTLGGLDVLINNAGIAGPTGPVDGIEPADWDDCLAVCLTGQFNCTRLAVPHLKASDNASIVNLSSAAGKFGFPLRTPYAAAKWGVIGLTKSLAAELGPHGIRCNAILPGLVEGDRIERVFEARARANNMDVARVRASAVRNVSLRTMVTARQLADQILFLCSPRGRTISGQAISIDGDTQSLS
ncbi:SDR family oxidoreductase [Acuticoccus sp.]|uniref:SDR family oxidoreductase n=1 Tax=Acuticoccus sp. TaxID=1904378 RepID=UPI003B52613D